MNITEQLRLWGKTHSAARAAEHAAAREEGDSRSLQNEARRLREHADRLHGEIYSSLGTSRGQRREAPGR